MRIALVGVGALGALFGARLSPVATTLLVTRTIEQARRLNQAGIRIVSDGIENVVPVAAVAPPLAKEPVDVALILTKSYDTQSACDAIAPAIGPGTAIVSLQNGLGNDRAIAAAFSAAPVVPGVTTEAATLIEPGYVRHAAAGVTTLDRSAGPQQTGAFAEVLGHAGFATELVDDIRPTIWRKLATNAAINGPTALLGVHNGAIEESEAARTLALRIAREVIKVASRLGVSLEEGVTDDVLSVARATRTNVSSMLQDIRAGRRTEAEAIYGAIALQAESLGTTAPTCEAIALLLRAWVETHGVGASPGAR